MKKLLHKIGIVFAVIAAAITGAVVLVFGLVVAFAVPISVLVLLIWFLKNYW